MSKAFLNISVLIAFLTLFLACSKDESNDLNSAINYGSVTDQEGNTYKTVKIGSQEWMAENLRTTILNDGTKIWESASMYSWGGSGASYCWYDYDSITNAQTYGALYNWHTVSTDKLCPSGWHVPTDEEWTVLTSFLGGQGKAGNKLKETGTMHWYSPNEDATNETGFSALPGGYRFISSPSFMGVFGYWWSSTENEADTDDAWLRGINYSDSYVSRSTYDKGTGASIRCVKD